MTVNWVEILCCWECKPAVFYQEFTGLTVTLSQVTVGPEVNTMCTFTLCVVKSLVYVTSLSFAE